MFDIYLHWHCFFVFTIPSGYTSNCLLRLSWMDILLLSIEAKISVCLFVCLSQHQKHFIIRIVNYIIYHLIDYSPPISFPPNHPAKHTNLNSTTPPHHHHHTISPFHKYTVRLKAKLQNRFQCISINSTTSFPTE